MPLYNKEKEVARAIHSALSQTLTDFELIIVNDGSTDNSPDVVRSCKDLRIKVLDQINQGVSSARNRGIAEAKADLIAFLDADDEWKPDYLTTVLRLVDKYPAASVFATGYMFIQTRGFERPALVRGLPIGFSEGILEHYFIVAAQSDPPLWTSAVAVRKKAFESIGGFPVGVTSGEDLLTWARLALRFEIAYSTHICAFHFNPLHVSDRPGRIPQYPDVVGTELAKLLQTAEPSEIKGVIKYIALWHRMRAVTLMHLGEKRKSIEELHKALSYSVGLRSLSLLALSLLPKSIMANIYTFRRFINQKLLRRIDYYKDR